MYSSCFLLLKSAEHSSPNRASSAAANSLQICVPPLVPVPLGRGNRISSRVDATPGNNKVGAPANRLRGSLVLLAELVPPTLQINPRGEDDKVLVGPGIPGLHLCQGTRGHEAKRGLGVAARQTDALARVRPRRQASLGRHLREEQEAALATEREARIRDGLRESVDDAVAAEDAEVHNVGPLGNAEGSVVVLLLDRVANVDELAVFEYHKVVLLGQRLETLDRGIAKVSHDIDVCLEHGDVRA